jgi:hypothetical protein
MNYLEKDALINAFAMKLMDSGGWVNKDRFNEMVDEFAADLDDEDNYDEDNS